MACFGVAYIAISIHRLCWCREFARDIVCHVLILSELKILLIFWLLSVIELASREELVQLQPLIASFLSIKTRPLLVSYPHDMFKVAG